MSRFERERSPAIAPSESVRGGFAFADRGEGGKSLAAALGARPESHAALLLAASARALPVVRTVAAMLGAPWDLALVRRIQLPGGIPVGAVSRGVMLINDGVLGRMRVEEDLVERLASQAARELGREEADLRAGRPAQPEGGRTAVLVDDGLGDPGDWIAAARALRRQGAAAVWLAAPALEDAARRLVAGSVEEILTAAPPPAGRPRYAEDERTPGLVPALFAEAPGP